MSRHIASKVAPLSLGALIAWRGANRKYGLDEPSTAKGISNNDDVRRSREAERRQLTFVNCSWELLDAEDMPSELDPEDRHDVTTLVNDQFQSLVQRYDATPLSTGSIPPGTPKRFMKHIGTTISHRLLVFFWLDAAAVYGRTPSQHPPVSASP